MFVVANLFNKLFHGNKLSQKHKIPRKFPPLKYLCTYVDNDIISEIKKYIRFMDITVLWHAPRKVS